MHDQEDFGLLLLMSFALTTAFTTIASGIAFVAICGLQLVVSLLNLPVHSSFLLMDVRPMFVIAVVGWVVTYLLFRAIEREMNRLQEEL